MKTKKDYKRAQLVVKGVIDSWDPYALLAGGAPNDEFNEEINDIVRRLPQIRSENDAIEAISSVMSSAFNTEDFTPEECTETGKKLFARCKEEGLI